ncbi:MAG: hypothetical protein Q9163_001306 [Psora crenata]
MSEDRVYDPKGIPNSDRYDVQSHRNQLSPSYIISPIQICNERIWPHPASSPTASKSWKLGSNKARTPDLTPLPAETPGGRPKKVQRPESWVKRKPEKRTLSDGQIQWRERADAEWGFPDPQGKGGQWDVSTYHPAYADCGPDRAHRHDLLHQFRVQGGSRPTYDPGWMRREVKGKLLVVTDPDDKPILDYHEIPLCLSSDCPGSKMEHIMRSNLNIEHEDSEYNAPDRCDTLLTEVKFLLGSPGRAASEPLQLATEAYMKPINNSTKHWDRDLRRCEQEFIKWACGNTGGSGNNARGRDKLSEEQRAKNMAKLEARLLKQMREMGQIGPHESLNAAAIRMGLTNTSRKTMEAQASGLELELENSDELYAAAMLPGSNEALSMSYHGQEFRKGQAIDAQHTHVYPKVAIPVLGSDRDAEHQDNLMRQQSVAPTAYVDQLINSGSAADCGLYDLASASIEPCFPLSRETAFGKTKRVEDQGASCSRDPEESGQSLQDDCLFQVKSMGSSAIHGTPLTMPASFANPRKRPAAYIEENREQLLTVKRTAPPQDITDDVVDPILSVTENTDRSFAKRRKMAHTDHVGQHQPILPSDRGCIEQMLLQAIPEDAPLPEGQSVESIVDHLVGARLPGDSVPYSLPMPSFEDELDLRQVDPTDVFEVVGVQRALILTRDDFASKLGSEPKDTDRWRSYEFQHTQLVREFRSMWQARHQSLVPEPALYKIKKWEGSLMTWQGS